MAEGKTKIVEPFTIALATLKDDVTAGDGARRDQIKGKAEASTETIVNVFEVLNACDVATAFIAQNDATSFFAHWCEMIPIEVVVRIEAHGSYLQRNPHAQKGDKFEEPIVELYLKTTDRKFGDYEFLFDDPLMEIQAGLALLYDPHNKLEGQEPVCAIPLEEIFPRSVEHIPHALDCMSTEAVKAFLVLREMMRRRNRNLVDFKVEFGADGIKRILLADDIDNGSWRVLNLDGEYEDKQGYRDGEEIDITLMKYKRMALLSRTFRELIPELQDFAKTL